MEQANLALDYLRAVIWPILAFGLVFLFRRDVSALLARVRRAAGFGFDAETWPPPNQTLVTGSTELVLPTIEGIANAAGGTDIGEEAESPTSIAGPEKRAAVASVFLHYERVYRLIFGTQIQMLHLLNTRGENGATENELAAYWAEHKRVSPIDTPFDAYLSFVLTNDLVCFDEADERYKITQQGSSFLQYLVANGISLQKPY